jgi:peroxiredoxin (alkyl hydroperoxide reductase subunit C)
MCNLRIGQDAPDFATGAYIDKEFKDIKLSDYRGKWVVLFFYPGDFTFVCTTELPALAQNYGPLKELDAEVLAVSVDSKFVHKVWDEQELGQLVEGGIPYPMLADTGGRIGRLYGVFDEEQEINLRGRFIIDPDGKLQAYEVLAAPVGRKVEEVVRQVQALSHARESGGTEVCPVAWEPGQVVLKPSANLVGNVWKGWKK